MRSLAAIAGERGPVRYYRLAIAVIASCELHADGLRDAGWRLEPRIWRDHDVPPPCYLCGEW